MSDHNYLFISDFHVSQGRDPETGKLSRNEDFFYDDAFARFLVYHAKLAERYQDDKFYERPWVLVINGDLFDFLHVTRIPDPENRELLEKTIGKSELTENEKDFGLGTTSRETAWKLRQIYMGHPLLFQALGWFLACGKHKIVILKGNHDIELYWPAVQKSCRQLVVEAYEQWDDKTKRGLLPDSPLPTIEKPLPLKADTVSQRIEFPKWFYYEPGLFYAEHGNQYEPASAVDDFLEPILEEDKNKLPEEQHIKLPRGSFLIRYFFTQIEQVHPFADNIKPVGRYIRWSLTKEPWATFRLIIANPSKIRRAIMELKNKPNIEAKESFRRVAMPLDADLQRKLLSLRYEHQKKVKESQSEVTRDTFGGVALNSATIYLVLRAIRDFVRGRYGAMASNLVAAAAAFVGGTRLSNRLDYVDQYQLLHEAAAEICYLLNRPGQDEPASVRYHIMGHDHTPEVMEIDDPNKDKERIPYRQWYINTGSWLPTIGYRPQLIREKVQLAFFRLIPGLYDDDHDVPQLLEWQPDKGAVVPIQLLEPSYHGKTKQNDKG
ncbi:MAG: hypothetical protein JSW55_14650 [Chloroflexota bacterium]|nr:MAG: hypothetical protein JSW55_14650 [Chloroflexota bacterium]